jgi:hypothetical protein
MKTKLRRYVVCMKLRSAPRLLKLVSCACNLNAYNVLLNRGILVNLQNSESTVMSKPSRTHYVRFIAHDNSSGCSCTRSASNLQMTYGPHRVIPHSAPRCSRNSAVLQQEHAHVYACPCVRVRKRRGYSWQEDDLLARSPQRDASGMGGEKCEGGGNERKWLGSVCSMLLLTFSALLRSSQRKTSCKALQQ